MQLLSDPNCESQKVRDLYSKTNIRLFLSCNVAVFHERDFSGKSLIEIELNIAF